MKLEKRKYSRSDFSQIIRYSLLPHIDDKILTGLLRDFSYSGMCMMTHHPLQERQEIVLANTMLDNSMTALVRWCRDTGNSIYKVGLEFKI